MPLVKIQHWSLTPTTMGNLAKSLPEIVSRALNIESVPEAHLTPNDIEVLFVQGSVDDVHQDFYFGVEVEAMHFPEREQHKDAITATIASELEGVVEPFYKFYVWLTLPIAGYAEVKKRQ